METDLRLILLGVGLLVVGGIILDGMRRRRKQLKKEKLEAFSETVMTAPNEQEDPLLEGYFSEKKADVSAPDFSQADAEAPAEPELAAVHQAFAQSDVTLVDEAPDYEVDFNESPDKVLALTILPQQSKHFSGRMFLTATQTVQMHFGAKQIFHRYQVCDGEHHIAYSLASLTEPGTIDIDRLKDAQLPGLMLFMVLPGPYDPLATFEQMMTTARQLAGCLMGEICDAKRQHLTIQSIEHYREQIRDYMRHATVNQTAAV